MDPGYAAHTAEGVAGAAASTSEGNAGVAASTATDTTGNTAADTVTNTGSAAVEGQRTGRIQRSRAKAEKTRGQVMEVAERVVAARPETPLIDTGFEIYEKDSRIAGGMLAGAIAFRLFLLLVPLLLVLVAGLGFMSASGTQRSASSQLDLSDTLVSTMQTVGQTAARGRWTTLGIGLAATVMAVRTLIKSLRIVHNLAWGTARKAAVNQPKAIAAGMAMVVLIVAYAIGSQWIRAHTPGGGVMISFVIGLGGVGVWMLAQLLLPHAPDAGPLDLLPGAVLVGAGLQAVHAFTIFYLAGRMSRMSETYGPLGVAIVALLWLYLLGRLIVSAAVINASLWERKDRGALIWAPIDFSMFRGER